MADLYCKIHRAEIARVNLTNINVNFLINLIKCLSGWLYQSGIKNFAFINGWNNDTYKEAPIALTATPKCHYTLSTAHPFICKLNSLSKT